MHAGFPNPEALMHSRIIAPLALLLTVVATATLTAQAPPTPDLPTPVVDETFSIPSGEFARVMLASGSVYRVEIASEGLQLQVRPIQAGIQDPLVQVLLPGESPSGTVLYTVRPRGDGLYEFRSVGGDRGRATRVRVSVVPEKVK
jgi:hypothetical protein